MPACWLLSSEELSRKQALQKAIAAVRPGARFREMGDIISQHVGQHKFQVAPCMSRVHVGAVC